ncbi:MAG TPA: toll/interleukin-1 receptor domain-containing protein [Pseudonocardiaceae bacterium]|jgi:hypothetical protein
MMDGAHLQQVYVELFVTSVMMKGRGVHRRLTERIITAHADNIDGYLAMSIAGWDKHETNIPIRALWGCNIDHSYSSVANRRTITKLAFPRPLRKGERHYFASEVVSDVEQGRNWVNIEVDHHGIAAGRLHGRVPIRGLVVRIQFDGIDIPEACWWYANQTEDERRLRPPIGDRHLVPILGGTVEYIFRQKCVPAGHYGLALRWPPGRSNNSETEDKRNAFDFDVAISFAGADRAVAKEIYSVLRAAGYRVFYDLEQQHRLLGSDLTEFLHDTYFRRSRYAIIIVSKNFMKSKWASNWEWRAVLARMQSQRDPYVLPYVIDEVAIPGLNPTIGFATFDQYQPSDFARLVMKKLRLG